MRLLILAATALTAGSVSAQTMYLPDDGTGFGLALSGAYAGGEFEGEEFASVGASAVGTFVPGLDVSLQVAREVGAEFDPVLAIGGGVAYYPVRTAPSRLGVAAGLQYAFGGSGGPDSVFGTVGLAVGYHARLSQEVTVVPHGSFVVLYGGAERNVGLAGSFAPAFRFGQGRTRFVAEPSVTYGFDSRQAAFAATAGVVTSL